MKFLLGLATLSIISLSFNSEAKNIYADVQVTNINPTNNFIWKRENPNTPQYPIELAKAGIKGCSVLSFVVSESGKAEDVEIINSVPSKHIGKYSRKMLKKWKWIPTAKSSEPATEKRTLRLDFCFGEESEAQSQLLCKEQTKLRCN